jgi:UDP-glucose 4-epimerase
MRILVTGGTGFIGSHTVVVLQQSGHEVYIIDNLSNSRIEILDGIAGITGTKPFFEQFDLTDRDLTARFFEKYPIDGVIHFAAYKTVPESVKDPLKYYRNNLVSLINLIENVGLHTIPYFVFSSSCTVYGQPESLPVKEDAPVMPAFSPYGNTKRVSEEILRDSVRAMGFKAVSLRYFNPIGAHSSALIGELPLGVPDNLMPYITQTAIGKRKVLNVYGSDYQTPDGTAIRDYIHVEDLAGAHVMALDRMAKGKSKSGYEVFNLGTGRGYSVMEVIRSFEKVSGIKLNIKVMGRRTGDVEQVWADTTLANTELGWKARKGLDEMTRSAWKWEQALAGGLNNE